MIKKFAKSHEWIVFENDVGTVGITDHAQHELTDIVFVDPPKVGTIAQASQPICVVESVKSASDIYSPVSGQVIESNQSVADDPALVNRSAEMEGWLYKIKLSNISELDNLLTEEQYKQSIGI